MGTHRSRHNKGRKPIYKEHRQVAMHLIAHPIYGGGWYNARTWWTDTDQFKLNILCEANREAEECADALGRPPASLVRKALDLGFVLPDGWAKIIAPKPKPLADRRTVLSYPYITKARDEHGDILAINNIIPKSIPENMRADMCQEIMLAVLEGRTTIDALKAKKANSSYFIKKFYHDNYEAGGFAISFQDTDEDWNEDGIASSVAAKEWRENENRNDRGVLSQMMRTYSPATQFEAAWHDQVHRVQIRSEELGHFLSYEEVEEMMEAQSELAPVSR